jgi:hypothetical protein
MTGTKVIIPEGVLPTTSTKINIDHVYLCNSLKCKKISFRKSLVKVRGMHTCPNCGSGVSDITFTELGRRFAGV